MSKFNQTTVATVTKVIGDLLASNNTNMLEFMAWYGLHYKVVVSARIGAIFKCWWSLPITQRDAIIKASGVTDYNDSHLQTLLIKVSSNLERVVCND